MIYIPGTGILAAYTDAETGALSPEFNQAIAIYLWAWFIVNTLYVVAAVRSSWVIFIDLAILSLGFLLLAVAYMTGDQAVMTAGYSVTMVTAALSCKSLSLTSFFLSSLRLQIITCLAGADGCT
jgi:succinate-acetate transporter protein